MVQKAVSDYIFENPIIPKARLFSSEAEIDTFFQLYHPEQLVLGL